MKHVFIALLLTMAFSGCARASSPIILDIATSDGQTRYYINGQKKSGDEAEAWFRAATEAFGSELIYVRPDDKTPFQTIFDALQRMKRAGVVKFHLVATDASGTQLSLVSTTASIQPEPQNLPRQIPE